jgi:hypothetical protein
MATRRIAHLTVVISSLVISIACVAGLSSTYGEELVLLYLDSRTGFKTLLQNFWTRDQVLPPTVAQ